MRVTRGGSWPRRWRRFDPGVLSIVVPVYNVEEYLDACLTSIRFQDYPAIEVVVVDDGSPDRSMDIARRHAAEDERVRLVTRTNGGLSAARNTGIDAARGEFLAFVDSDDTVTASGYRAAVESLQSSGSDFAVLSYRRMRGDTYPRPGIWISHAHQQDRTGVSLAGFPEVQVNAMACSKVIRRSFWKSAGLRFAEDVIYEDQMFSSILYTAARSFDVLAVVGYNWRIRSDVGSISQGLRSTTNLRARIVAARHSLEVLRETGHEVAFQHRVMQLLSNDFPQFVRQIPQQDEHYMELLEIELARLIALVPTASYVSQVPAQHKVLYALLTRGEGAAALDFIARGGLRVESFETGVEPDGLTVYLPYWDKVGELVNASDFCLSERQTPATVSVVGVSSGAGRLELDVVAGIAHLDRCEVDPQIRMIGLSASDDEPLELPADVAPVAGRGRFAVSVRLEELPDGLVPTDLAAVVDIAGHERTGRLRDGRPSAPRSGATVVGDGRGGAFVLSAAPGVVRLERWHEVHLLDGIEWTPDRQVVRIHGAEPSGVHLLDRYAVPVATARRIDAVADSGGTRWDAAFDAPVLSAGASYALAVDDPASAAGPVYAPLSLPPAPAGSLAHLVPDGRGRATLSRHGCVTEVRSAEGAIELVLQVPADLGAVPLVCLWNSDRHIEAEVSGRGETELRARFVVGSWVEEHVGKRLRLRLELPDPEVVLWPSVTRAVAAGLPVEAFESPVGAWLSLAETPTPHLGLVLRSQRRPGG